MSYRKIPKSILHIMNTIEANGFKAYLVGGSVRDMIMGRRIHDWDITTSASVEDILSIFERTVSTGAQYGTVTVFGKGAKAEVTTFRTDGDYADSRHPESVCFVKTLDEDLARRDFTVNAMAMDKNGLITDLFDGQKNIEQGVIKCVGKAEKRFSEDALRMMRAVRFSAQLGFEIEHNTECAMKALGESVSKLSAERVLEETVKTLLSDMPERLMIAFEYGMFNGRAKKIPNIDALKRIGRLRKQRELRLCALAYILDDLDFLKNIRAESKCIKLYEAVEHIKCESEEEIKFAIAEHGRETAYNVCCIKDVRYGGSRATRMKKVLKQGNIITMRMLAVNGNDLIMAGIEKGAKLGLILRELLIYVNRYPDTNQYKTLLQKAMELNNNM